jgi:hypothetical protein
MVRNATEDRHAGTGTGPSMATYGESKPGVWKIERLGGGMRVGRTWVFSADPARHGAEVEAIAQERAFSQPELSAACREYLGPEYEELLRTEVFTRWARANGHAEPEAEPDGVIIGDDDSQAAATPPPPGLTTSAALTYMDRMHECDGTVLAEEDPLRRWESQMGEKERAKLNSIAAKLDGARRVIEETMARPAPPQVAPEVLAARVAEDWHTVGVEAVIPEGARPRLTEMLGAPPSAADALGGTTIRLVAEEFGVSRWTARQWLEKLRVEGVAYVSGRRATARWKLFAATPPGDPGTSDGGDGGSPAGA